MVKHTGLTTNVVVLVGQTHQPQEAPAAVLVVPHQQAALVVLTDLLQASTHHQAVLVTATASQVSPQITAVAVAVAHGVPELEAMAVLAVAVLA